MTGKNTILITGSTGQVGRLIQEELTHWPHLDIVLASRKPKPHQHSAFKSVYMDYNDRDSIRSALENIDTVFMMTSYSIDMLQQSKNFVDVAKQSQLSHIVHLGACGDNDTDVAHWGWHQFIEKYIESSGIGFTHLRPEAFMQNILGYQGDNNLEKGILKSYFGNARLSWVDCRDVAKMAIQCLSHPTQHHGQTYRLGHDAKTYAEIAQIITEETGIDYRYEAEDPELFWKIAVQNQLELTYMKSIYDHYVAHAQHKIPNADATFSHFSEVTAQQPTDIRQFIRQHLSRF